MEGTHFRIGYNTTYKRYFTYLQATNEWITLFWNIVDQNVSYYRYSPNLIHNAFSYHNSLLIVFPPSFFDKKNLHRQSVYA